MLSVRGSRRSRLASKVNAMLLVDVLLHAATAYTNKSTGYTRCVALTAAAAPTAAAARLAAAD
jgi:ribosomal protein L17